MTRRPSSPQDEPPRLSRRRFLKRATGTGAALTTGLSLGVPAVLGAPRDFKVGVIGCGGRGTGASKDALEAAKLAGDRATIHALADLFPDKVVRPQRRFDVPDSRCFYGFNAFRDILETDCDYYILATPPHFRAEHFEACVAAGKHVFTEKPVAVDPPGIRRFLAAGEKAEAAKLSVAAGTQRRHANSYLECFRRVSEGAIGDIVAGRCYWNMGGLWSVPPQEGWSRMEWQVRNWLYFTWLSGDHIVEQHVHQLDVMNWYLGAHPIMARGMGGREVRKGKEVYGNVFDHFATELVYPNPNPANGLPDVRVTSMARQIDGCWNDVSEFLVGTGGGVHCGKEIYGRNAWKWKDDQVNPYVQEHADLMASIKGTKPYLNEAETVATSTMTAILARTSCYSGEEVRWDDLMASEERRGPTEYAFGPAPEPLVARPGKPM